MEADTCCWSNIPVEVRPARPFDDIIFLRPGEEGAAGKLQIIQPKICGKSLKTSEINVTSCLMQYCTYRWTPCTGCHAYSKTCSWLSGYHGTMRPFHLRVWHIHVWCPKCWSKIYQKTTCQDLPRTPRCLVSGSCSKGEANSRKPMPWHINQHINGSCKRCRLSSVVDGQNLVLPSFRSKSFQYIPIFTKIHNVVPNISSMLGKVVHTESNGFLTKLFGKPTTTKLGLFPGLKRQ